MKPLENQTKQQQDAKRETLCSMQSQILTSSSLITLGSPSPSMGLTLIPDLPGDSHARLEDRVVRVLLEVIELVLVGGLKRRVLLVKVLLLKLEVRHDGRLHLSLHLVDVIAPDAPVRFRHCHTAGIALFDVRGRRGPAVKIPTSEQVDEGVETLAAGRVLREEVRRIGLAQHLAQVDTARADRLLDP